MASRLDLHGPLLVRAVPLRGEGLRGYLLRVSELNGLLPSLDLYRILVGVGQHLTATRSTLTRVAEALSLPSELVKRLDLEALSWSDSKVGRFAGHQIALARHRGSRCALCPRCIDISKVVYAAWDLTAVTTCPRHGCWLIDHCPQCGKRITWRRLGVSRCVCGYDLAEAPTASAPLELCAFTAIVEQRLRVELPTGEGSEYRFPEELDTLPVSQLLGTVHLFTNVKFRAAQDCPPLELPSASRHLIREAEAARATATALANWPLRWRELQEQMNAIHFKEASLGSNALVTQQEAAAPFFALLRPPRFDALGLPSFLQSEIKAFLRKRTIWIGRHKMVASGSSRPQDSHRDVWRARYRHLSWRHDFSKSRFSTAAALRLLDATEHQFEVLKKCGVVARSNRSWIHAPDLNKAIEALAAKAQNRPRAKVLSDLVELSEFSGNALARRLNDVLSGRTPCYTWAHMTPPGLANLFIPAAASEQEQ